MMGQEPLTAFSMPVADDSEGVQTEAIDEVKLEEQGQSSMNAQEEMKKCAQAHMTAGRLSSRDRVRCTRLLQFTAGD